MNDEVVQSSRDMLEGKASSPAPAGSAPSRGGERSPRKFPYYPLAFAVELVERIYAETGGSADRHQVAEILEIKPSSSTLEMRIISAGMFGLVARREGRTVLEPLGRRLAAPTSDEEKAADLSAAFDNVDLFSRVRRRFAGSPLPGETGFKVLLARDFGVSEAQRNDAYNILMRSAKDAGILVSRGSNQYLTSLPSRSLESEGHEQAAPDNGPFLDSKGTNIPLGGSQLSAGSPLRNLHSSISGLVNELAIEGGNWDAEQRRIWQAALSAVLDYVYPKSRKSGGGESRMGQANLVGGDQTRQPPPPEVDIATD